MEWSQSTRAHGPCGQSSRFFSLPLPARGGAALSGGRGAPRAAASGAALSNNNPPPSHTNWTRLVHPSVLIGHVSFSTASLILADSCESSFREMVFHGRDSLNLVYFLRSDLGRVQDAGAGRGQTAHGVEPDRAFPLDGRAACLPALCEAERAADHVCGAVREAVVAHL